MRYDYRCTHAHVTTTAHPMGQQPNTIACPICQQIATRYFRQQRVQTTEVLWSGRSPKELPYRDNGNPIGALAYT